MANMLATPVEVQPDRWAVLQNHPRSPNPDEDTFYALLAALDAGWRVEPPVYVSPRWGSEHAGTAHVSLYPAPRDGHEHDQRGRRQPNPRVRSGTRATKSTGQSTSLLSVLSQDLMQALTQRPIRLKHPLLAYHLEKR